MNYYVAKILRFLEKDTVDKDFTEAIVKIGETIFSRPVLTMYQNDFESFQDTKLKEFLRLYREEKEQILIDRSPIDINKLVQVIQNPPMGSATLQAFTKYKCAKCDEIHTWHNSGVPTHCNKCATDLAKKIILGDIYK